MHIHVIGHEPKFSVVQTPPLFNGKSKGEREGNGLKYGERKTHMTKKGNETSIHN